MRTTRAAGRTYYVRSVSYRLKSKQAGGAGFRLIYRFEEILIARAGNQTTILSKLFGLKCLDI